MSIKSEIGTDIYRQMIDLQEKLRQSESERIRLEEMFTVLVKTFREEENMRLKNLENRYHMFLEDCARRSCRNEKILRSIERVQSGANALHAKSERLKLLRSHYEAYLERVIPTWKQPALFRYGQSPFPSMQEVEWSRRNQLILGENLEPSNPNYLPFDPTSRPGRPYNSNRILTSEYFSNRPSDGEKHITFFHNDRHPDKSYWNDMGGGPERKETLVYGYDKSFQRDMGFQNLEPSDDTQTKLLRGRIEGEFVGNGISARKEFESSLYCKPALGNRSDLSRNILSQEAVYKEMPTKAWNSAGKHVQGLNQYSKANASPAQREDHWFSDRKKETLSRDVGDFDKNYIDETPRMTREPVEMKKPEIIVGKIQPEASLKVDYFCNDSNFDGSSIENVKSDTLFKPSNDSTSMKNGRKIESPTMRPAAEDHRPSPQANWSLLKHKRTIDKLKETLSFEEAQEQKLAEETLQDKNIEILSTGQKSLERLTEEGNKTEICQSLSDNWQTQGEQLMSPQSVVQTNNNEVIEQNTSKQFVADETSATEFGPTYQENFEKAPQKYIREMSEEVFEDNEESYPESYYEQPPKSDYSRDIVSNVILEEDENEMNVHNELPEGSVHNQQKIQENDGYEQSQFHPGQGDNVQTNYNGYGLDERGEMKEKENEYHNFQPGDLGQGYNNVGTYQTNYGEVPQEGYTYDTQEMHNYENNGLQYNTMEQYPGNAEAEQQYYESQQPQELRNYGHEGMSQGVNFGNTYNQDQNYETNPSMEQYNEGDGTYQVEYKQGRDGNYYGQGQYSGYYLTQQEQNEEYRETNEQKNMGYSEAVAYGNIERDGSIYADGSNNLPLRQSNLSHLLESDSDSFQMEHGSAAGNEDSDFDFSMSQQQ